MNKPDYFNQANPDLLCRIPVNASAVLEVGCGAGALGAAYKAINPNCTYIGVEVVAEAALRAQSVLDHVLIQDVESEPISLLPCNVSKVDCLIYGDVLEHLREPHCILQDQLQWLSSDGIVLACIPNVQHWSTLVNLIRGRWPQVDQGLFDRTHLRWFTRSSMIELFRSCGLEVQEIQPRVFSPDKAQAVVKALSPSLPSFGLTEQELLNGISPLQYVITARRPG